MNNTLTQAKRTQIIENIIIAISILFVAAVFGFNYGEGNQNTYLIDGLIKIHPNLLLNDWLARETIHYHKAFSYLIILSSYFGNLAWNLAIINYLVIVLSLLFIYKIIRELKNGDNYFIFLMYLFLVVLNRTNSVGDSYFFSGGLQPSTISSLLTIVAVYYFIRSEYFFSGLALGFAGLFHTNFLLLGFVYFGFAHLILGKENLLPRLLKQLSLSAVVLIPQLPFLIEMSSAENAKQAQYIFQYIRSPHHYVPLTYLSRFFAFYGWHIIAVTLTFFGIVKYKDGKNIISIYYSFLIIITIASLLTTIIFIPVISQLFFFRMAPFSIMLAQLISLIFVSQFLFNEKNTDYKFPKFVIVFILFGLLLLIRGEYYRSKLIFFLFILFLVTISFLFIWQKYYIHRSPRHISNVIFKYFPTLILIIILSIYFQDIFTTSSLLNNFPGKNENELYKWVKTTPKNSKFLVPPDMENFRIHGQRAIVADWKSTPVDPKGLLEWYKRIGDICGNYHVMSLEETDFGYSTMDLSRLKFLEKKYDSKYAVFYTNEFPDSSKFDIVFRDKMFIVYELKDSYYF